jgi:hypothetical protein
MTLGARRLLASLGAGALLLGAMGVVPAQAGDHDAVSPVMSRSGVIRSLSAVSAVSRSNAWAVGWSVSRSGSSSALILHWDGKLWSTTSLPDLGRYSILNGVAARSSTDAWAVGQYCVTRCYGDSVDKVLVLHWDGSEWAKVPTPNPSPNFNGLSGVSADTATDAWAVGSYELPSGTKSLVLHWNGRKWLQVASPNPSQGLNALNGVSAISRTDVWATGLESPLGGFRNLLLHWNGTRWSRFKGLPPVTNAVTSISGTDVWAVGQHSVPEVNKTLALHWNGLTWSKVRTPNPSSTFNGLDAVAAASAHDVWAVGSDCASRCGQFNQVFQSLIVHWNGKTWTKVPSPNPARHENSLYGVSAVSLTDAWAVGTAGARPLILHWDGRTWSTM